GDHIATARSIARVVGIGEHATDVAQGANVKGLADEPLDDFEQIDIFARVSPAEKIALVRAYQEAGGLCRKLAIWTNKLIRYGIHAARISNCSASDGAGL